MPRTANPLNPETLERLQKAAISDKKTPGGNGYSTPTSQALNKAMKAAWGEVFPGRGFNRESFIDEFDKLYPDWRGYYVSYQPEYRQQVAA
jgi:hypothetical protein